MPEQAFKGTVLEGRGRRYTVLNERDIQKYSSPKWIDKMQKAINDVMLDVEEGRKKDGKNPYNSYIVINVDEPYISEIIEIMKANGQWEENDTQTSKLEIINGLNVIDEDVRGEEVIYVSVAYTDENIKLLSFVVPDINEYLRTLGDPDDTKEYIDISNAAFCYAGADFYENGKFVYVNKDELIEMYLKEQAERKRAQRDIKILHSNLSMAKQSIKSVLNDL